MTQVAWYISPVLFFITVTCVYQVQNYQQPFFSCTAREVSNILDTSLTETTVSTDTKNSNNNISTDLEFDLIDLEVLVVIENTIFLEGLDVAIGNETLNLLLYLLRSYSYQ